MTEVVLGSDVYILAERVVGLRSCVWKQLVHVASLQNRRGASCARLMKRRPQIEQRDLSHRVSVELGHS